MKQINETLYDKNSSGKIKQWSIYTDGPEVVIRYGQEGGKITEKRTTSKAKNIGKSNETTPSEQAVLEATSKHSKQVKRGYVSNKSKLGQKTLPPLAEKYQDSKQALKWPVLGSYKLDGVRCTCFYKDGKIVFQSRGGDPYPVIKVIADELYEVFFKDNLNYVVDGELYCHGMFLEDIVSSVRKPNENTFKIKFHIFDLYDPNNPEYIFDDRSWDLEDIMMTNEYDRLELVKQFQLRNEAEMLSMHKRIVSEKYEGIVLRNKESLFKFNQRTSDFQKYKVQMDEEFVVVSFEQGKNGCVSAVCEVTVGVDTKTFKAPLIGTLDYQQEVWDNQSKFLGKSGTVLFEKYSKYGIPTKPKFKCFRDVNEKGEVLV